jgi:hypothetical protein
MGSTKNYRTLSLINFSVSTYWVLCLKRRNNIVFRKITKLGTQRSLESEGDIIESTEQFVIIFPLSDVQKLFPVQSQENCLLHTFLIDWNILCWVKRWFNLQKYRGYCRLKIHDRLNLDQLPITVSKRIKLVSLCYYPLIMIFVISSIESTIKSSFLLQGTLR